MYDVRCPLCCENSLINGYEKGLSNCWLCKGLNTIPYEKWAKYMRGELYENNEEKK